MFEFRQIRNRTENMSVRKDAILGSLAQAQHYVDQASQPAAVSCEDQQPSDVWPGFMPAFLDKGRQRDLVSRIPVKLVRCPHPQSVFCFLQTRGGNRTSMLARVSLGAR